MRTHTLLTTVALVSSLALAGCGSSSPEAPEAKVLTKPELASALITLNDLGPGFQVDKSEDDEEDMPMGCLDGLDELDSSGTEPVREKEGSFMAKSELEVPAVMSSVGTFRTEALAAKALKEMSDAFKGCKKVDVTDEDGFRMKLAIASNKKKVDPAATDQVNLEAVGTGETDGVRIPVAFRFSAIQVDNQVALVMYMSMVKSLGDGADAVVHRAYERLAPIAAGEKAPKLAPLKLKAIQIKDLFADSGAA